MKGPIVNLLSFVFHVVSVATSQLSYCSTKEATDSTGIHEHSCVLVTLFLKIGGKTDLAVGCRLPSPHINADAAKQ